MKNVFGKVNQYLLGQADYHPTMLYAVWVDATPTSDIVETYTVDIKSDFVPLDPADAVVTNTSDAWTLSGTIWELALTRRYSWGATQITSSTPTPGSGKSRYLFVTDGDTSDAYILAAKVVGTDPSCVNINVSISGTIYGFSETDESSARTHLQGVWDHIMGVASYPISEMYLGVGAYDSGTNELEILSDTGVAGDAFTFSWGSEGIYLSTDVAMAPTVDGWYGDLDPFVYLSPVSNGALYYGTIRLAKYRTTTTTEVYFSSTEDIRALYAASAPTSPDSGGNRGWIRLGNIWDPAPLA